MTTPSEEDARLPRVFAFDLDGTLWSPDMCDLAGGGSPFTVKGDDVLEDKVGQTLRLLGVTREALFALEREAKYEGAYVAFISSSDEPGWAQECMGLFNLGDGLTMGHVRHIDYIAKRDKSDMFARVREESGVDYADIVFYDNEAHNMENVAPLGVRCVYSPEGLTSKVWEASHKAFARVSPDDGLDAWEAALQEFGCTSGAKHQ